MEPKEQSRIEKIITEITSELLNEYTPDEQNEIIIGVIAIINDNRKSVIENNMQNSKHLEDCISKLSIGR